MFLFKILSVVSVAVVVASAQEAARYPAGVNPALCPDFPNCDNARLHDPKAAATIPIHDNPLWNAHAVPGVPTTLTPQPQWNAAPAPQPQWNAAPQPQWNAAPQPQWNAAPAPQPQWNAAPAPQWNAAPAQATWNFVPAHVQDQFQQWSYQPAAPAPVAAAPAPQPQAYTPLEHNDISDTAGGDKYPAGVNPAACPNYPYCDTNTGLHAGVVAAPKAAPLPGYTERQYPAGVSAHECPNFPYCN